MFFKCVFTVVALGLTVFIALQGKTYVKISILSTDLSVPVAALVYCFLALGVGIGIIWCKAPRRSRIKGPNQVPIIADLKVSK